MAADLLKPHDELVVADSFRVRWDDGTDTAQVRGFELHLGRFRAGVTELLDATPATRTGATVTQRRAHWAEHVWEPFFATLGERIQRGGAGFPRLELRRTIDNDAQDLSRWSLELRLRPLPQIGTHLALVSTTCADVRFPWIKGPNLERHTALNRRLGAEALLVDAEGQVLEGATTAVVWWSEGELHVVDSGLRVPSICEQLVVSAARSARIAVRRSRISPQALVTHEVWSLNALHGIRPVVSIDGVGTAQPDPARLAMFRQYLEETWRPVLGPAR